MWKCLLYWSTPLTNVSMLQDFNNTSHLFVNDLLLAILYLFYDTEMGLDKNEVHPVIFENKMGWKAKTTRLTPIAHLEQNC